MEKIGVQIMCYRASRYATPHEAYTSQHLFRLHPTPGTKYPNKHGVIQTQKLLLNPRLVPIDETKISYLILITLLTHSGLNR
jgi:hypothetical protein